MRKKIIPLIMAAILSISVIIPSLTDQEVSGAASEAEIKQKLAQIEKEQKELEKAKKQRTATIKSLKNDKKKNEKELATIKQQIETAEAELVATERRINEIEQELLETGKQLEEVTQRIEEREGLIGERIRFMYTNGAVSYLDVLLGASSFTDFIERFDMLSAFVNQDKDILVQNEKDQQLIAEKQAQVEVQLAEVVTLREKQSTLRAELESKKKSKQVMIASVAQNIEEHEEATEKNEAEMVKLAKEKNKLYKELQKLKPYSGSLGWPLEKGADWRKSSNYGNRRHPVYGTYKKHNGVDLAAAKGTDIVASADGVVITARNGSGYGYYVIINHGNDAKGREVWTLYAHMLKGSFKVKEGDKVKAGEKIGEVGKTGTATGYHLHYEVRLDSVVTDPANFLGNI